MPRGGSSIGFVTEKEAPITVSIKSLGPAVLELDVHGKLEARDYDKFKPMAEERIREHGKVDLVVHVSSLSGWTPSAFWEDLKFDVAHYRDVSRLALIGEDDDKRWMATLSKPFTAAEVKYFPEREITEARRWVLQASEGNAPLASARG